MDYAFSAGFFFFCCLLLQSSRELISSRELTLVSQFLCHFTDVQCHASKLRAMFIGVIF